MLENAPEVAPLLVRLYDTHNLYALAQDKDPQARGELTSVMVDLMQLDLNPSEKELITDVLMALMRQAEKDLRAALAERLAAKESVPLRIVLHLASDEIAVADSVLRNSPVLQDMDLVYLVKSKGKEHWRSIARRENLGDKVVDSLAETRDLATAVILTENKNQHLTDNAVKIFANMARSSDKLARPLLMREELPAAVAGRLYEYVGQELKDYIVRTFGENAASAAVSLNDVVLEFRGAAESKYVPSEDMRSAADQLMKKGILNAGMMLDTLRRGQIASFISMFATYCGLTPETAEHILRQENGQGLAIACRATGLVKSDFLNIYLLTNRVRSGGKIVNQSELAAALHYFDKVTTAQARKILAQSKQ